MPTSSSKRDWSELPDGILYFISTKLETRNDVIRFRAVRTKFESLIPPPPERTLPLQAVRIPYPIGTISNPLAHYNLLEFKIYAIQSLDRISNPSCWIVKVQESGDGQARFKDTLSRVEYGSMVEYFPRPLNLMDYEITEIAKAYELLLVLSDKFDRRDEASLCLPFVLEKIVVSDDLDIMAVHSGGRLTAWRKGYSSWTELEIDNGEIHFQDAIYFNNKFYAVDGHGRTVSVDCKTLKVTEVVPPLERLNSGIFKYLMRLDDCFHLVVKFRFDEQHRTSFRNEHFYPVQFVVFKVDQETGEWTEKMDGFQDRVFCVGDGCSYSFLASEFPGTKGNSVYFNDTLFREHGRNRPGWEAGIYNISDYTSRPISHFPGYSRIFWPPPAWL